MYGNHQTADTLGELLAACGQEVLVAYAETTACDLARTHRPDVVFLDLRIHSGEVVQRLRQLPELQDTALVAITAPGGEAALRLTECGFAHYLVEPIDPLQVQALMKRLKTPR